MPGPISTFLRHHYRHFNAAALIDAADGYREQRPRTPDREFFNGGLPPRERRDTPHD